MSRSAIREADSEARGRPYPERREVEAPWYDRLAVELHAHLPGVGAAQAKEVMEAAHLTCPYSKALRGDTVVTLVVD